MTTKPLTPCPHMFGSGAPHDGHCCFSLDLPTGHHSDAIPDTWTCLRCGGIDSKHIGHPAVTCTCWVGIGDIAPADLKAMLASDGVGVGSDGTWQR